jgi:ribosomal protein S18 acetylase RimI-like enzyme
MDDVCEPLQPARVLAKPKKFAPLRNFSCGRKGKPWETTVNKWARSLYLGTETHTQTVVMLEDANGKLVGLCSYRPDPLPIPAGSLVGGAQLIHLLGTDRLCHGKQLEDGSRPGDVLLQGALEHIKKDCGGRMPYVWALVSPENDRSQALFDRHGFGELPYKDKGEIVRVLSPNKRLPVVALRLPTADRMVRWIVRKSKKTQDSEHLPERSAS